MATKGNPALNKVSTPASKNRDENRSDITSENPKRVIRTGAETKRTNQRKQRDASRFFEGLKTLYG